MIISEHHGGHVQYYHQKTVAASAGSNILATDRPSGGLFTCFLTQKNVPSIVSYLATVWSTQGASGRQARFILVFLSMNHDTLSLLITTTIQISSCKTQEYSSGGQGLLAFIQT